MKPGSAIWPPVLDNLSKVLDSSEQLVLVISPFIKSDALGAFLDTFGTDFARVIVRWKIEDLLAGVSDLQIFELLEERGIPLYQHPKIHLKLYEFSSGCAYSGSSNITKKGLSLQEPYNEEMGVVTQLDLNSFTQIRRLCDESRRVTREMVVAYQKAINESKIDPPIIGELVLPPIEDKEFLVSELPATETIETLLEGIAEFVHHQTFCPKMMHDIVTLKLTQKDLNSQNLKEIISKAFAALPFVTSIVREIRSKPSSNFGAITRFVHDSAQDVPLPYRSEIKAAIARLYPWLESCFRDISYSVPGARSQVIESSLYIENRDTQRRPRRRRRRE
ncbi:phospholipase D family protein [Akkermansiaceae bacterium]|nr:phospholipase D family protein [Akkermansiaceae bacterium]MDB4494748.1 phospholipase D family protein [Akkermansiaceae bacterium]